MMNNLRHWIRYAGLIAALSFFVAAIAFGARHALYSHLNHSLAILGARQAEYGLGFNLFAFLLPGALAACALIQLRDELPRRRWEIRIGMQLLLLSALALAAQGLFTLDLQQAPRSRGNAYHLIAWLVWSLAFVVGAALVGITTYFLKGWRRFALSTMAAAILVLFFSLGGTMGFGAGIGERGAFVCWFLWLAYASWERHDRDASQNPPALS